MTTERPRRWMRFRAWHIPAAILAVLLVGFALWLLPRRAQEVVLVDGAHRWDEKAAPPQRKIVWRPAEAIAANIADPSPDDSLVRPQFAEGGIALYYTLQRPGGEADIYRSQFDGQRWLPGNPVAALNSPASDFGPVISADGKSLYLYSDRPGGYGGFDLYVSRRTASGWSQPNNLGPHLNTPAHEYDPAITPDGQRLFFASNRTSQMNELVATAAKHATAPPPWKATLRSEPGMRHFDIYVAERNANAKQWKAATNLRPVNTSSANEGEPIVSPDGAFLYFASDRPNAHGRSENYDIYRARLTEDGIAAIENLGPGVNSAANEHDPALSPEGFRLVFSSNRAPQAKEHAELYGLYTSQATETFDDAYWDTSHLAALANLWWWIVLALIVLGLLAALVRHLREVSLRRAPLPVFFLIALFIHLLALTGAFFIPIEGQTLAERITRQIERIVAADIQLESTHQSHAPGEKSYEKVADLQSLETTQITATPRQVLETPNMPFPTQRPAPTLPNRLNREQLSERVATSGPVVVQEVEDPQMARRQKIVEQMMAESVVKIDPTKAVEEPQAKSEMTSEEVATERTAQPKPLELASQLPRRKVDLKSQLEQERISAERPSEPTETPQSQPQEQPLDRLARSDIKPLEAPKIEAEAMAEATSNEVDSDASQPAKMEIEVQRQPINAAAASVPAQLATRPRSSTAAQAIAELEIDGARPDSSTAKPNTSASAAESSSLERQDRLAKVDAAAIEAIATDAPEANPMIVSDGAAASSPSVEVELSRRAGAPTMNVIAPSVNPAATGPRTSTLQADIAAEAIPASAPSTAGAKIEAVAALARRGAPSEVEIAEGPSIAAADMPAAPGTSDDSPASSSLAGEAVRVDRSASAAAVAAIATLSGAKTNATAAPARPSAAESVGRESAEGTGPEKSAIEGATTQLARAAARGPLAEAAEVGSIATETMAAGEAGPPSEKAIDGIDVQLARATPGGALSVDVKTPDVLGGRYDTRRNDLVIGELAKAEVDADVSFSPIGSNIDRQRARAPFLLYAQDRIGLQAMLRLRVGDDGQKQDLIDAFGGRKDTLEAIQRGLHWLALVQHEDGHWDLKNFPKGPGGENFSGHGSERSDTAATGLGLLPFLGDGHTHEAGKYQATVAKGIAWLLENQKDDGDLFSGGEGNAHLYSHGIATIALCEAFGMTKDEKLQGPAQRAVDFIVKSQHDEGGWRYKPRERGDTSVVGWQIMALKSAQMAGLNVPGATLDKARDWLNKSRYGQEGREFAYQPGGGGTIALTAEGLLCMEYLGGKRGEPQLMRTVDAVVARLPKNGQDTSYYWYYGTQAIFHIQGEPWKKWNDAMSDAVLTTQVADGPHRGTWDPRDEWEQRGGRIYSTSLRLLMLEVYFRHLPLYQALE